MKLLLSALLVLLTPGAALATGESGPVMEVACETCHFCPAPLGFCVLIWAIAALLLLLALVLLIGRHKKCPICGQKCKRREWLCPKCNYNFDSGQFYQPYASASAPSAAASPASAPAQPLAPARSCPHCGRELPQRAQFCAGCGQKITNN